MKRVFGESVSRGVLFCRLHLHVSLHRVRNLRRSWRTTTRFHVLSAINKFLSEITIELLLQSTPTTLLLAEPRLEYIIVSIRVAYLMRPVQVSQVGLQLSSSATCISSLSSCGSQSSFPKLVDTITQTPQLAVT